jgi:hypothetical protein
MTKKTFKKIKIKWTKLWKKGLWRKIKGNAHSILSFGKIAHLKKQYRKMKVISLVAQRSWKSLMSIRK